MGVLAVGPMRAPPLSPVPQAVSRRADKLPEAVTKTLDPGAPQTQQGSVSDFLVKLRSRSREAFLTLRALALSLGPDVTERVKDGAVIYSRRDRPFLAAEATRSRLLAVFPESLELDDPMGRLLRRGSQRYAPLDAPDSLDAHVQDFVRHAYTSAR